MSRNGLRVLDLMRELQESPEHQAHRALLSLATSTYMFSRNYADLSRLLTYMTEDPRAEEQLMPLRNRDLLEDALREVARLLHNFVSAAMSLVWHTTRLRHAMHADPRAPLHRDPSLDDEVDRRVNSEFVENALAQFVQKLRVYAQKFGLPSASFQISQAGRGQLIVRKILLPTGELRKWTGWNIRAKEYLDDAGEDVDVVLAISDYERRVRDFYIWFEEHYRALYTDELAEFERKEWELALLELEDRLALAPADARLPVRPRREEVFVQVLGSRGFAALEALPDGPERGERAIALLEERGPLPEEIKDSIRSLYAQPDDRARPDAESPVGDWEPSRVIRGGTVRLNELVDDSIGDTLNDLLVEDAEIVGPIIVVPVDTTFDDCTWDVIGSNPRDMFWEVVADKTAIIGGVALRRCCFVRCNFLRVGIAGSAEDLAGWQPRPRVRA